MDIADAPKIVFINAIRGLLGGANDFWCVGPQGEDWRGSKMRVSPVSSDSDRTLFVVAKRTPVNASANVASFGHAIFFTPAVAACMPSNPRPTYTITSSRAE